MSAALAARSIREILDAAASAHGVAPEPETYLERALKIKALLDGVAAYYDVAPERMAAHESGAYISKIRGVALYLARVTLDAGTADLARAIKRDTGTVSKRIAKISASPSLRREAANVRAAIGV